MRLIGPIADSPEPPGLACGIRPKVGLIPNTPQNEDGIRIEPAPSPPWASGPMPSATAAAAPPLEPPAVSPWRQGLWVEPCTRLVVSPFHPSSGVAVLPSTAAPASRSRATTGASAGEASSAYTSEP